MIPKGVGKPVLHTIAALGIQQNLISCHKNQ